MSGQRITRPDLFWSWVRDCCTLLPRAADGCCYMRDNNVGDWWVQPAGTDEWHKLSIYVWERIFALQRCLP